MDKEKAVLENRISELEDIAYTQHHNSEENTTSIAPLYKLAEDYETALNELTPMIGTVDSQYAIDTLEGLKGTVELKSTNLAKYVRRLEGFEMSLDNEIKRLQTRKKQIVNTVEWIKKYVKINMERIGRDKIETDLFVLKITKNPPKVVITDPDILPPEYTTKETIIKYNKTYIKEQLKHREIAGVELVQDTRLEIK